MTATGLRLAGALACAIATLAATSSALRAAYPERPVTVIVPFPAGGSTDLVARASQEAFAKAIGGTIVIKNVVGASGTLGGAEAAAATPDGYSIFISPIGPIVIQPQRSKLTYQLASWDPVCKLVDSPVVLMVGADSKYKTVAAMAAAAKAAPGKLLHGTAGPGTVPHMAQVALSKAFGAPLKHVPYKGSAEVVQAIMSGTVHMTSEQPNLVLQYNLHPVAVFAEKRIPTFPGTPTMKESGYDLRFSIWNGVFAPKGTPEPVLAKLESACKTMLQDASVKAAYEKQRQPIQFLDRKAFTAFLKDEYARARVLLEEAGMLHK